MKRALLATVLWATVPVLGLAQEPSPPLAPAASGKQKNIIDVPRAPAGNTFEALWNAYKKASEKADPEGQRNAWQTIRRLRVERNIPGLETISLALIERGQSHLTAGEREKAEADFRAAAEIDPRLPDAHFAIALAGLKKGPAGFLTSLPNTLRGFAAAFSTSRGSAHVSTLLTAGLLVGLLGAVSVIALALVLRHGPLLLHDLEETLSGRHRAVALGAYVLLLLLPAVTFQGFGWLPLWWLALLFTYLNLAEKIVAGLLLLCCLTVGPLAGGLEARIRTEQNPLYRATMQTIEGESDQRAIQELDNAIKKYPDDRDLAYLLGLQYKKAGRYDDSANVYREILKPAPTDTTALNNLGNISFALGEFASAIARYKQGIETSPPPEIEATLQYNKSLAHLQLFEYQPAQEARGNADRLAGSLIRAYDELWRYEKGDFAVVDLSLSADLAEAKFHGAGRDADGAPNVAGRRPDSLPQSGVGAGSLVNRFSAFLAVVALVYFLLERLRGSKMFTLRCLKCGTPFCRKCHLGATFAGLCTQCHHLFIVRDGVSGPARNQKMLEVQKEEQQRERIFRVLSLLSPGAGHLYARKTVAGTIFILLWTLILALALLAGNVLPVTDAPAALVKPWGLGLAVTVLVLIYGIANRARPDFEIALPTPRAPSRRRTA